MSELQPSTALPERDVDAFDDASRPAVRFHCGPYRPDHGWC